MYQPDVEYLKTKANNILNPTKTNNIINDWTAVAQNVVVASSELDCSTSRQTILHLQAALDTVTAHTGTRFRIQTSNQTSGNEDWNLLTEFVGLIGTAKTDLIENNPLSAGSTSITLTAHLLTTDAVTMFIEDSTLSNSEIVFKTVDTVNAISLLDGTTNSHVLNTAIFDIAFTMLISIPDESIRTRLVIDNTYDSDGSSLNYKLSAVTVI